MQLHCLGVSGYHPSQTRQTACFMLPEIGVVFDAGTGFHRVRSRIATPELDVFLSHAHLDHVIGVTFLFDTLYQKETKVRVHAEQPKIDAICQHLLSPLLFPVAPPCQFVPLKGEVALSGGGRLRWFPLKHPGGSVGYRIDLADRSMAYVTDTTAALNADYIEQIRGVDLLLHECYFPDGLDEFALKTGHSCVTPVAQVAKAAGVGRLVLTHVNPLDDIDDPIGLGIAQKIFPETVLAEDEMVIEF
ncbi:MBL fold metallo-hydrolase [Blastopirellula sp. JC732]|uniref:MBL fold metallo-hydrolase n=1 Tax=Blastopirellula sediminis TaxID=2894196 RepID=A0A9X1SFY2_9BACT|nr:MBL fold metallo-hydrolase [Blastopirellula sediminis]MCC9607102.1 MBL fold metallo-hydrolase [Blastopirellula sediminis]MCC9629605.1 MBL fold metallo-hydrolase [Blastopirellula sediminis]